MTGDRKRALESLSGASLDLPEERTLMSDATKDSVHEAHWRTCVNHNKKKAVLALAFAAVMSLSSWKEIGRPFPPPEGADPFMVHLGLVGTSAVMFYLFLSIRCIYERLWLGIAAVASTLLVVRSFYPTIVAPSISDLRTFDLFLWLAATIVSLAFVKSAFKSTPPQSEWDDSDEL